MNRVAVTACVALGTAGTLAAIAGPARAGAKTSSIADERHLVVTLVTPTVNQEVLPALGDSGLKGVITVKFSTYVNPRDIIDYQNVVNYLSSKVEFLNSSFARLPGTPSVRRNVFTFDPRTKDKPELDQGQYTLNLKSSIRSTRGALLNEGVADFTTTFSVGVDIYPPVLRRISPVDGQTGIGLFQKVCVTFNEPLLFASLPGNMTMLDGSTNPPSTIGGTFTLQRGGFDVCFTPDPCFGYPPLTNVSLNIQGQTNTTPPTNVATVTDVFQNKFNRDPGLQWTRDATIASLWHSPNGTYDDITGLFTMTFQTKGTKPPPSAPPIGNAQLFAVYVPPMPPGPCFSTGFVVGAGCSSMGSQETFTTSNSLGVLDLRTYINTYTQGKDDYSLINIVPNSPVRMGRPGGIAFDRRFITSPVSQFGHTFLYVVDERAKVVNVVRSDTLRVLGRFTGFTDPRDVSFSTDLGNNISTLYVTDFGANQVVAIDVQGISVSFTGQPGVSSPCELIKDSQSSRRIIPTGAGPTEVSADGYLHQLAMVTNSLDNSITLFDPTSNKVTKTVAVGSNPTGCDWVCWFFGGVKLALVTNQGGLNDPNGSIMMYVKAPASGGFLGAAQTRDGVEGSLTEDVKNPSQVWGNLDWIDPPPPAGTLTSVLREWWAANTGGTTSVRMGFSATGLFGASIAPKLVHTYELGLNPTAVTLDSFFPNQILFAAVAGLGSVAVTDPDRDLQPVLLRVPGVRKLYNSYTH